MSNLKAKSIGGDASVLLDTIRIVASFTVVITHAHDQWATSSPMQHTLAHTAVLVFFVLSGYVIAFTTTSNNRGPKQYAVARLSRLYSIVLPALLLTGVIQIIVTTISPELAASYTRGNYSWLRYLLSAFFCSEGALFSASPPMNNPLWSLNFEFWYYVIFGLCFYRHYLRKSWLFIALAFCIAGPKILLLMPIWLGGVFAYRLTKPNLSTGISWILVFLLFGIAAFTAVRFSSIPFVAGFRPFYFANQFVSDWITGVLFALSLWLMPNQSNALEFKYYKYLRLIADLSFPLYILHFPLLILWRAVFGWQNGDDAGMWWAIVTVCIIAMAIGFGLDKYRGLWIKLFKYILSFNNSVILVPSYAYKQTLNDHDRVHG